MSSYAQILNDLKNKIYQPVYFFMGEEPYYIDALSDYIAQNVLDASEREFNQSVLYGRDVDVHTVIGEAKRYPMMSNHNVVIVKEAQHIRNIEELEHYIKNPLKSTMLVVCYKDKPLDKRKSFGKNISKQAVVLETKRLYDNQVPAWIDEYVKMHGYSIGPKASAMLAEFLGNDLGKIANELGKLMLNVPEKGEITAVHIEQNIGISKDYNNFELNNALAKKDVLKASRIVTYFAANPKDNPLVVTLGTLYGHFSKTLIFHTLKDKTKNNVAAVLKINPFFVADYVTTARNYSPPKVRQVISLLREYDLKSKGVESNAVPEGELLKELVFKILH